MSIKNWIFDRFSLRMWIPDWMLPKHNLFQYFRERLVALSFLHWMDGREPNICWARHVRQLLYILDGYLVQNSSHLNDFFSAFGNPMSRGGWGTDQKRPLGDPIREYPEIEFSSHCEQYMYLVLTKRERVNDFSKQVLELWSTSYLFMENNKVSNIFSLLVGYFGNEIIFFNIYFFYF